MELDILNRVHDTFHSIEWLNYAMKYLSLLAKGGAISIVCCVLLLLFKRTRRVGLAVAFAIVVDVLVVNIILKNAVGRARPWTHDELWWAQDFYNQYGIDLSTDYCFPSGHTAVTFCVAAVLVIYYRAKAVPAVVLALLIGLSRIYLCEHYVTDVVAGVFIGSACGVAGYFLCRTVMVAASRLYKKNYYKLKVRAFRTSLPSHRRRGSFLSLFI